MLQQKQVRAKVLYHPSYGPRHQINTVLRGFVGSAEKVTKAQIIFTSPKAKRKIHWKSDSWWNGDSRIVQKSYSIAVTCDTKVQGF
jgi:hypothetical protein